MLRAFVIAKSCAHYACMRAVHRLSFSTMSASAAAAAAASWTERVAQLQRSSVALRTPCAPTNAGGGASTLVAPAVAADVRLLCRQLADVFAALPDADVANLDQARALFAACADAAFSLSIVDGDAMDASAAAELHHALLDYCTIGAHFSQLGLLSASDQHRALATVLQCLQAHAALRQLDAASSSGAALHDHLWSEFDRLQKSRAADLVDADGVAFRDQHAFSLFVCGYTRVLMSFASAAALKRSVDITREYLVADAPEQLTRIQDASFKEVRHVLGYNQLAVLHFASGQAADAEACLLSALNVSHHVHAMQLSTDVQQPLEAPAARAESVEVDTSAHESSDSFFTRLIRRIFRPVAAPTDAVQDSIDSEFEQIRRSQDQIVSRMLAGTPAYTSGAASKAPASTPSVVRRSYCTLARRNSQGGVLVHRAFSSKPDDALPKIALPISNFAPIFRVLSLEPYLDSILAGRSLRAAFSAATQDASAHQPPQQPQPQQQQQQQSSTMAASPSARSSVFASPSLALPEGADAAPISASEAALHALTSATHVTLCNLLTVYQTTRVRRTLVAGKVAAELVRLLARLAPRAHAAAFNAPFFAQHTGDLVQASHSLAAGKLEELGGGSAVVDSIVVSRVPPATLLPLAAVCCDMAQRLFDNAPMVAAPFLQKSLEIHSYVRSSPSVELVGQHNMLVRCLLNGERYGDAQRAARLALEQLKQASSSTKSTHLEFLHAALLNNLATACAHLNERAAATEAFQQCVAVLEAASAPSPVPGDFGDSVRLVVAVVRGNAVLAHVKAGEFAAADETLYALLATEQLPAYLRTLFLANAACNLHAAAMWPEAAEAFEVAARDLAASFGDDSVATATAQRWRADCLVAMCEWADAERVLSACLPRLRGRVPMKKLIPSYLQLLNILSNTGRMADADRLAAEIKLGHLKKRTV